MPVISSLGKVVCKSSEFDCNVAGCMNPDHKKCRGTCIPKEWANDGEEECADGSDEGTIGKNRNANLCFTPFNIHRHVTGML